MRGRDRQRIVEARTTDDPMMLAMLLEDPNARVAAAAAARLGDTEPLRRAARDRRVTVREGVARNGACPEDLRRELALRDPHDRVRAQAMKHAPESWWDGTDVREVVAAALDNPLANARAVAARRATDPRDLACLARDEEAQPASEACMRVETPAEALHDAALRAIERCRADGRAGWHQVARCVAANPVASLATLEQLVRRLDAQVRRVVVGRVDVPERLLVMLADDDDQLTAQIGRWRLGRTRAALHAILELLSWDDELRRLLGTGMDKAVVPNEDVALALSAGYAGVGAVIDADPRIPAFAITSQLPDESEVDLLRAWLSEALDARVQVARQGRDAVSCHQRWWRPEVDA